MGDSARWLICPTSGAIWECKNQLAEEERETKVYHGNLEEYTALWKTRNDMVHGKTQGTQAAALQSAAAIELRSIYDSRAQLEPTVEQLLFREVQDHTKRHQHSTTRNWLHTNEPIFRESLRRAKRRAIAGVRSIRSYFAPVRWTWLLSIRPLDAILFERVVSSRVGWPPRSERSGSTLNWV